jgi:hypothetical protein
MIIFAQLFRPTLAFAVLDDEESLQTESVTIVREVAQCIGVISPLLNPIKGIFESKAAFGPTM